MTQKIVAVIGGGPSGIFAVKALLEEGIKPMCFERSSHIGGLWRYHDDDINGLASVMKTTIINTSKELSSLSDFPPPEDVPNYMHHKEVYEYLTQYAKKFHVNDYVQFNKEIIEVNLANDYSESGRLSVVVKDTKTGETVKDIFDGVLVCTGHHVHPHMPDFTGMERFAGKIIHTHSLKNADSYSDQVVVVVGTGNSGLDAAVELSSVAKQVYLSTRRGTWVLPRVGPWGLPLDLFLTRRVFDLLKKYLPLSLNCWLIETIINQRFDHETYNIKPAHRFMNQHPSVSDALPIKLLSGRIKMKRNIQQFEENSVIFKGENDVTNCQAVIFATGYEIKFSFLNERLTTIKHNRVHLYKYVFPPELKHPTLAIIGLVQTVGAGLPVIEAQTRWVTLVLSGKLSFPPKEDMEADILRKKKQNEKLYINSKRHTIQVDYIQYLDEINGLFGAKPNYLKMFFLDPELFWTLVLGPSLPYQYRLQGPHSWPEARNAILNMKKRVYKPLKENFVEKSKIPNRMLIFTLMAIFLLYFLINFCFFVYSNE